MILLLALAILLAGAWIGARGMRRFGASLRRVGDGTWRPGAAVVGGLLGFTALALLARGEWAPALGLLALGALAAFGARRPAPRLRTAAPAARMGRGEAARVLGVGVDAPAGEVEAAYRRLMRAVHPDAGGTAGLAAQLNAARDAMLRADPAGGAATRRPAP